MTISRALARPLSRPLKRNLYSSAAAAFTPTALFANGEQGAWYDPSDLTTMFQTDAGVTPAVVGSTVGLILDKSKGPLGPELVTNGTFDTASGWTDASVSGGTGFSISGGKISVFGATLPAQSKATQSFSTEIGVSYFVRFTKPSGPSHAIRIGTTSGGTEIKSRETASGFTFVATAATTYITLSHDNSGATVEYDNVSIKKSAGNHALQATAASRPILQVDGNGKHYLAFDGVDDFLVTGNINFSATDEMSVFAGVRKLSDAAAAALVELSVNSGANNSSFAVFAPGGASPSYAWRSRGTSEGVPTTPSSYTSPITNILSCLGEISADTSAIRVNGAQVASSANDQGTGNYGAAYPLYIGRRAGTSLPFNGRIYSLIVRGKLTADADLTDTEAYVATQTGVTL